MFDGKKMDRALAWGLVIAALAVFGLSAAHRPSTGLVRRTFTDDTFQTESGEARVDRHVYFDGKLQRRPQWLGERAAVRWEGFLDAPRDGSYSLRLESDDGAWLWLDGDQLLDNGGRHPPKMVQREIFLTKGPHPIRIDYVQDGGGATMRLEWRLPAGYNAPGLVPVSSLHPEQPAPEGFLTRLLGTLPWLLLGAAIVVWNRRSLSDWRARIASDSTVRQAALAGAAIVVLALGVRLVDLNGAGETCDEWAYVGAGKIYAENLFSGIFDSEEWKANREHPAIGKLVYGFVQEALGDAPWTTRAAAAVMGALTILVAFAIALRLFGLGPAIGAGIILSLLPPFVAHGKVAALDAPATLLQALAIWLLLRALHDPSQRNRSLWWLALVAGLAVATKLTNGLVVIYALFVWPLVFWRRVRETKAVELPLPLFLLPILALIPFVITWPWLWAGTGEHLRESFGHWEWVPSELFFGRVYRPPPHIYFVVAFALTTPVLLFVPFILGFVQPFRRDVSGFVRMPEGADVTPRAVLLVLAGWVLLPFAWSFSLRQDGIRYVLAAFIPFAIFCGLGLSIAAGWLGRRLPAIAPRIGTALTVLVALYLGIACARVHPYYLDYFNEVLGGPAGVWKRRVLETAWWGEGTDRAVEWLNANAPTGATWSFRGMVDHNLAGARRDLVRRDHRPDFLVRTDFTNESEQTPGFEQVFRADAAGAPVAAVYRRVK